MHIEKISNEAFRDGSTIEGAIVSLKAKFQELFISNWENVYKSFIDPDEILNEIAKIENTIANLNKDKRTDVSYIPINAFVKHLIVNGNIVKKPRPVLLELNKCHQYFQVRNNKLMPAWAKFLTLLIKSIEKDDIAGLESSLKALVIPDFKRFLHSDFIGAWFLDQTTIPSYKDIYFVNYNHYSHPIDALSLHVQPYNKIEIQYLLEACKEIVKDVSEYYFVKENNKVIYNKNVTQLEGSLLRQLGSAIENSKNTELLKKSYPYYNDMTNNLFNRSIEHGVKMLYTVKAVIRIIEASIRRY